MSRKLSDYRHCTFGACGRLQENALTFYGDTL